MVFPAFGLLPWKTVYDYALRAGLPARQPPSSGSRVTHYLDCRPLRLPRSTTPISLRGMQQRVGLRPRACDESFRCCDGRAFAASSADPRYPAKELLQSWSAGRAQDHGVSSPIRSTSILLGDRIAVMSSAPAHQGSPGGAVRHPRDANALRTTRGSANAEPTSGASCTGTAAADRAPREVA